MWFLLVLILAPIIAMTIVYVVEYFEYNSKNDPRVTFEEFKKWYSINSAKWVLRPNRVYLHKPGCFDDITISFSFIDWTLYQVWYKQYTKQQDKQATNEVRRLLLQYVQEDIDKELERQVAISRETERRLNDVDTTSSAYKIQNSKGDFK